MTLRSDFDVVDVGEITTGAAIEDGIAIYCQGSVGADGEARSGGTLDGVVELELVIGDDFTGTMILVGEDTILQADDGVGVADGFGLRRDIFGDVVRGDFESASVVLIAPVGSLS